MHKYIKYLFVVAILTTTLSFCSKNTDSNKPSNMELLTSHTWRAYEMRALVANTPYYYKRGETVDPSYDLENESITFSPDNTGTYVDALGTNFTFTWQFTNSSQTHLTWTVAFTSTVTINWDIVELNKTDLLYNEYYANAGQNTQTFAHRIP